MKTSAAAALIVLLPSCIVVEPYSSGPEDTPPVDPWSIEPPEDWIERRWEQIAIRPLGAVPALNDYFNWRLHAPRLVEYFISREWSPRFRALHKITDPDDPLPDPEPSERSRFYVPEGNVRDHVYSVVSQMQEGWDNGEW